MLAFHPLLALLLPLKIEAIAGADRLSLLTVAALAGAVTASGSNILFGWLSDRGFARSGTRKPWIVAGLVATMASYGGIALAATPATVVAAVVAFQAALNLLLSPLFATMADAVPDAQKGLAGGLLALASPLGSLFGSALTAASMLGEDARFLLVAAAAGLCVVPLLFVPRLNSGGEATAPADRSGRRIDLLFIWAARLLVQIAGNVLFTYLFFYFETVAADADPLALASRVGWITGLAFLLGMPISVAIGRASDRIGARKPFLLAAAFVTALGLTAMAIAPGWTAAVTGFVAFAVGTTVFFGLHSALAMQILPSPAHRGRDLGLLNLANTLPALFGPALTWLLAATHGFAPVLLALAGLSVLGGLLLLPVRSSR